MEKVVIGTRGSKLSIAQTQIVIKKIRRHFPKLKIETRIVKTYGDIKKDMKLDKMEQKGVFVNDIDRLLASGEVDMAVHSLKDIPTMLPDKIRIGAVVERADPRDVIISRDGSGLGNLAKHAIIGTSSLRRRGQLLAFRGDLKVIEIRGNVDGRLAKLDRGDYDAIVLAAAGVKRLGLARRISEYLPFDIMLPAPGQGAIAVEIRKGNGDAKTIAESIDDAEAKASVEAERTALAQIGGGCNSLLGAFAEVRKGRIDMHAAVTSRDGARRYTYAQKGQAKFPMEAGQMLAESILASEAAGLLKDGRCASPLNGKRVLVTREEEGGEGMYSLLLKKGAVPVYFPTIKTVEGKDYADRIRRAMNSHDIIIINSSRGAHKLSDALGPVKRVHGNAEIAAIGPRTKKSLQELGIEVNYMPKRFYSKNIASSIKHLEGKKIMIVNSAKADGSLEKELARYGCTVDRVTPYTVSIPHIGSLRKKSILTQKFDFVTFASPSAVDGLIGLLGKAGSMRLLARSKVVCIGNTTYRKCLEEGIRVSAMPSAPSVSGMVRCMERRSQ